ncbi:MAG: hypothetical protein FWH55_03670 [Oscillospiraceae bacterium]|nr:hypothetical protein [Oscillospiraceae bacterium]
MKPVRRHIRRAPMKPAPTAAAGAINVCARLQRRAPLMSVRDSSGGRQ